MRIYSCGCAPTSCDTRVYPDVQGQALFHDILAMNILFLFWFSARNAAAALGHHLAQQDQRKVDRYLGKSQSFADLESRERHWLQSQ